MSLHAILENVYILLNSLMSTVPVHMRLLFFCFCLFLFIMASGAPCCFFKRNWHATAVLWLCYLARSSYKDQPGELRNSRLVTAVRKYHQGFYYWVANTWIVTFGWAIYFSGHNGELRRRSDGGSLFTEALIMWLKALHAAWMQLLF